MNKVENFLSENELLPIIETLIIKALDKRTPSLSKNSSATNYISVPNGTEISPQIIRAKELELIERVIRLEEQGRYIQDDIKKIYISIQESRQDMNKGFSSSRYERDA